MRLIFIEKHNIMIDELKEAINGLAIEINTFEGLSGQNPDLHFNTLIEKSKKSIYDLMQYFTQANEAMRSNNEEPQPEGDNLDSGSENINEKTTDMKKKKIIINESQKEKLILEGHDKVQRNTLVIKEEIKKLKRLL